MKRLLCLIAVFIIGVANAGTTIIYQDDFSGDGSTALNGLAPDIGSNVWVASAGFYDDGTQSSASGGALLPFEPESGKVYELSVDILIPSTLTSNWVGFGFQRDPISSPGANNAVDRMCNAGGYGWLLYHNGTDGYTNSVYEGVNTNNKMYRGTPVTDTTVSHTFKLVLDTTGIYWIVEAYADDVLIEVNLTTGDGIFETEPDINYVGLTTNLSGFTTAVTFDNFLFTVTDNSVYTPKTVLDYPEMVYDIYVDATVDNLWPTNDANYPALEDWSYDSTTSTYAIADLWFRKEGSTAAINGTVFQGLGVNLPQLTMDVNGLDNSKVYDVYAVCWVKKEFSSEYWYTYAAIGGNQLKLCDYYTADIVFDEGQFIIQGVQVYLGQVSGVDSFTVDVDGPVSNSSLYRAWFDGVALVEVVVDSTLPVPGQHDYSDGEVVTINAYDYLDCPEYNTFSRWIGDVSDPYSAQTTVVMDSEKTVTAVFTEFEDTECGDVCHPILSGDLTRDCMVDMDDLMILITDWFKHNE